MVTCATFEVNYPDVIGRYYKNNEKVLEFFSTHGVIPQNPLLPNKQAQNMEKNEGQLYCLRKSVEELTTSGKDKLDDEVFKKVKKICKISDIYVIELYKLVYKQLKKNHAEIRFSAFQICDEIFRRSHCFRNLVLKDFKQFTSLVLGLNPRNPLPKPISAAKKLKQKGVETIKQWYDNYGEGYITLQLGYKFLRDCKKVDFAELTARTEAQRQRDEEARQRLEAIKRKKIEKINNELDTATPEIKTTILQFQNGFKLLIPDVHNFFIPLDNVDEDIFEGGFLVENGHEEHQEGENTEYGSEDMRTHGIMKGVNVTINLEDVRTVKETADNEVVIQNLKEHVNILSTKFLPQVKKWEETMRPYSEGNGVIIKRIIDQKNFVESILKLFKSLKIEPQKKESNPNKILDDFDSDDDDDFIEVPFDDLRVARAAASEAALLGIKSRSWGEGSKIIDEDPFNMPSTSQVSNSSQVAATSANSKVDKKTKAVYRCPDEYLSKTHFTPSRYHNPLAGLSQIWQAASELHEQEEIESTGGILGVATQRVHYERTWEPVRWECRAPLSTGRLCPRRDREKCPLHGPIVARDELGQPLSAEDAARERAAREQYERDHPVWQDPHLLAEIKATTGVDLKISKGRAKRKRKYENLTDLRKTTPYDRLAKKVLNRRSLKRVNKVYAAEHSSSSTWGSSNFNFNQT